MSKQKRFALLDDGTEQGRFASFNAAKQRARKLDLKPGRAEIQDTTPTDPKAATVWRLHLAGWHPHL